MIRRLFVTKKQGADVISSKLIAEFRDVLKINVKDIKEFIRYDIYGVSDINFALVKTTIFSELPVDDIYNEHLPELEGYKSFIIEYLPGQYDQRADSAAQCVQLLTREERPQVRCARVIAIAGINDIELNAIKNYMINPVESREGKADKPITLEETVESPEKVQVVEGFINLTDEELIKHHSDGGYAMSRADLKFVRDYFASEGRNPYISELKVIDTYWSDHCRHTTFLTEIKDITINSDNPHINRALNLYQGLFNEINANRTDKYKCLMDIATIAMKKLIKDGILDNLDISDEINACSITVTVDNDGKDEEWLIMFKNETHNHPTEIEPFGGAATCLGGAIRDPLSGRSYVYQAMRITGSGDPRESLKDTMQGKLPQRVITKTAAAGFSSYGNQIGLATGIVDEMYHKGYKAKRLETGFVIGGAKKENVIRRKPNQGDVVVLLGGDTGRDGCGGATGSSKAHTLESVELCGAEVQKGNPLTERKMQRLMRNPRAARLIIKCNDFGAGGVAVAIGELSDGIDIYLDNIPKKYSGLNGTELIISESQERMAVMLDRDSVQEFINLAEEENLKCTPVAKVTELNRVRMFLDGDMIVDLSRDFLNTNGVRQSVAAIINDNFSDYLFTPTSGTLKHINCGRVEDALLNELSSLNVCAKKGMSETFDSTIGSGSVLLPWGGKTQLTPSQVMAAKVPVSGYTDAATVCAYACYANLNSTSPFIGAIYSIVSSISKLIAAGVDRRSVRLTLQEYFKKLKDDPIRWGEPLSAMLGALYAQINLSIAAIGGKDSMSGSFEDIDVPPTLISFAVGIAKASEIITNVYGGEGNLYLLKLRRDKFGVPDFEYLKSLWDIFYCKRSNIKAASVVEEGGALISVVKSALGNKVGVNIESGLEGLFAPAFGDIIILSDRAIEGVDCQYLGKVVSNGQLIIGHTVINYDKIIDAYLSPLKGIFPIDAEASGEAYEKIHISDKTYKSRLNISKPRVFIPIFPGTNCEYDTIRRFELAGATVESLVVRNLTGSDIEYSVKEMAKLIAKSNIIAFPGGFSGGDEPDGSGKFIATAFRNPEILDKVAELLHKRDGLIIGICNGFQALIKLGLVPYGKIINQTASSPTLTYNNIARHVSTISRIKVVSNKSPWLNYVKPGETYSVAISHGEGRLFAPIEEIRRLSDNGQIVTQYIDIDDNITMKSPYNPNGSMNAIEGIISCDGRVLGKMGHSERIGENLYRNYPGKFDMRIFESGVDYYR